MEAQKYNRCQILGNPADSLTNTICWNSELFRIDDPYPCQRHHPQTKESGIDHCVHVLESIYKPQSQ